jgi:hypothetical protein
MTKYRGIMATTHVDKHNERVSKEELERYAAQINNQDHTIWLNWNHQSTLPPIGTMDNAWVEALEDGEFGLFFEGGSLPDGEDLIVTRELEVSSEEIEQLNLKLEGLGLSHDPRNFRDDDINQIIEILSREAPIEHRRYVRKSEVPQSVIWVIVGFMGGGIAAGFLNRVGEKIADKVIEVTKPFLSNIGETLGNLIGKTIQGDQPDYVFMLQIPGVNENVEGALESPTPEVLVEACEKLPDLFAYTVKILSQNQPEYFQDIKFLYNSVSHQWEINFLTIKKTHKVVLGKRYYIPDHPLRLRYEQELEHLKEYGKQE